MQIFLFVRNKLTTLLFSPFAGKVSKASEPASEPSQNVKATTVTDSAPAADVTKEENAPKVETTAPVADATPAVVPTEATAPAAAAPAPETNGIASEQDSVKLRKDAANTKTEVRVPEPAAAPAVAATPAAPAVTAEVAPAPEQAVAGPSTAAAPTPPGASVGSTATNSRASSEPPTPVYNYEDGNWSPANTRGARAYPRELILQIKEAEMSKRKLTDLPDLDVVKDSAMNTRTYSNNSDRRSNNHMDFMPPFISNSSNNRQSGGRGDNSYGRQGGYMQRGQNNSMQGSRKKQQKVIESKPTTAKAQLKTTEHAWTFTVNSKAELNDQKRIIKELTGILNKISPDNIDKLQPKFKLIVTENTKYFQDIIVVIFSKAVDEPGFSPLYSKICRTVSDVMEKQRSGDGSFKKGLLVKCQIEFEKLHQFGNYKENKAKSLAQLEQCTDPEQKKILEEQHTDRYVDKHLFKIEEMKAKLATLTNETEQQSIKSDIEHEENKFRNRSIGLIKFVAELFKEGLLNIKILNSLITMMADNVHVPSSAEALCKLLTVSGKKIYNSPHPESKSKVEDCINKCKRELSNGNPENRIKFMLLDAVELFDNGFVAKHIAQKSVEPSSSKEVREKMEQESIQERSNLSSRDSRSDNRSNRMHNRGSGQRDFMPTESSEVWKTVVSTSSNSKKNNSLRNINARHQENNGGDPPRLGPGGGGFSNWSFGAMGGGGGGSSGGNKDSRGNSMGGDSRNHQGNRFNALQDDIMPDYNQTHRRSNNGGNKFGPIRNNPFKNNPPNAAPSNDDRYGSRESSFSRNSSNDNKYYMPKHQASAPPVKVIEPKKEPALDLDKLQRKAQLAIQEYISAKDSNEAVLDLQENFPAQETRVHYIKFTFMEVLEKKESDRMALAELLTMLCAKKEITEATLREGVSLVSSEIPDLVCDVPQVNRYLAQILSPLVMKGLVSLNTMCEAFNPAKELRVKIVTELLVSMVRSDKEKAFLLYVDSGMKGADVIRDSKLSLEDLLEDNPLLSFLDEESVQTRNTYFVPYLTVSYL